MRLYSGIDIIILCRDWNSLQFEINSYPRGKDSSPGEIPKCPARRLVRWSRVWGTTVEVRRVFLCLPGGGGHWALGHPKVRQSLGLLQGFFCLRRVFCASTPFFSLNPLRIRAVRRMETAPQGAPGAAMCVTSVHLPGCFHGQRSFQCIYFIHRCPLHTGI